MYFLKVGMHNTKQLYIVHCVDTEGPLSESLEATFERLRGNKSIDMPPSLENLLNLQEKKVDLSGREDEIADYLHPKRLNYLKNWDEVGAMLKKITSEDFRMKYADSLGNPYTFSWFIIDIVGYKNNPRNKSIGFHSVWDHFHEAVTNKFDDTIGWHFHTVPANRNAIEYNTCWSNNDWHERSLCRRLIERSDFPSLFRAGGHIERNDLSYWFEQFIPFDFSCRSYDPSQGTQYLPGAINDWRGAPYDWSPYNPCFYDYRRKGNMKRTIFRALDVDSNACSLNEYEVEKAFDRAFDKPTILAVSSHDRRDMLLDVEHVMKIVKKVSKRFPEVKWRHSNALKAAQYTHDLSMGEKPQLEFSLSDNILRVSSDQKIFGPQPFLAIKEEENFYRDNFTIEGERNWVYSTPKGRNIEKIGIAASSLSGLTETIILDCKAN